MSKWIDYAKWNERNERMSKLWIIDASNWIRSNTESKNVKKILDYGCSYFDIGEALACDFQEVHGYDIDQQALGKARRKRIPNSFFHDNLETIQDESFDVIVLSSVMQYFSNHEEVDQFFLFATRKLKKSEQSYLLITDIIPRNYIPWKDALENFLFATLNNSMLPMLIHLFKAAVAKPDFQLLKSEKEEILKIAKRHGFKIHYLDKNLTPSRRRYSCVCTLV